jgi:serine/threonine protein kinase
MAAPTTADDYLDLVRKSELIDATELSAYLDARSAQSALPRAAKKVARLLIKDGLLTKFQAEQLLVGKYKPFTLCGKYRLLERLGVGGMGFVYLCEHLVLRRRVAIKVLPTEHADSRTALERFRREARASASLDHPNIVRTHDLDQDGGMHFLVMEYVDGRSFHEIVTSRGPLSVERAAHYVAQASVGLQHAHERGLVHRDIKPANMLLDREGLVKLLDLGLARFSRDDGEDLTKQHAGKSVLGTADFVAPEQALDSHAADIRSDLYSLGCTFYYLLTGQPPFGEFRSLGQKLMAHQNREPRPVRELRPEIPEDLAAVLARMIAKKPADRYQTPVELFDALEPWTRNPIEPPGEEEMPQFCPAVQGAGSTSTSRNLTPSAVGLGSKIQLVRSTTPVPESSSRPVPTLPKPPALPPAAAALPAAAPPATRRIPGGPLTWAAVAVGIVAVIAAVFLLK